jgi:Lrp/AsnC family leucine-responsive transcriptional regulator
MKRSSCWKSIVRDQEKPVLMVLATHRRIGAILSGPVPKFGALCSHHAFGMELDRFDRQLLRLVQADAGQTAERLAEQVALSPSAIQRRLRRLHEHGVIEREVALVDPKALGPTTFFIAFLQVERERADLMTQLRRWLMDQEQVQQAFYVTGDADFVLVVTAQDAGRYEAFMSRLMQENVNVKRYTTNVAMHIVKRGLTIPIWTVDDV